MSIFHRTEKVNKKTTISLLQKECTRLEKERNALLARLHEIEQYKQDYEDLIRQTAALKARYEDLIARTEDITDEYKKSLEDIQKENK